MKMLSILAVIINSMVLGAIVQRDFFSDDSITWKSNFDKCIAEWDKANRDIENALKGVK